MLYLVFFFKQKTAYELRSSDWSSDVCSSDLLLAQRAIVGEGEDRVDGRPGVDDGIGAGRKAPLLGSGRGGGLHVFGNAGELRLGGGDIGALSSEERRGGEGCGRKCRSRWSG